MDKCLGELSFIFSGFSGGVDVYEDTTIELIERFLVICKICDEFMYHKKRNSVSCI